MLTFVDQEGNALCDKVLAELEDIDDDAESNDIDFVKISDPDTIEEYNIVTFPTLVFFRRRFPQFYDGKLIISFYANTSLFMTKKWVKLLNCSYVWFII